MSQITIQCRLVASEATRKSIWQLMAEKNTPLINEILWRINNHQDFKQWQFDAKLPSSLVSDLCKSLKNDSLFSGQPSRFYLSVTKLVNYIYKSWLKLQQRRQRKLEGQKHWLSLCIRFNGLGEHIFLIYCDRRKLHWFQSFLEDQQINKESKDAHSSGLFTLRSAKLAWKEDQKKNTGKPWNDSRLVLFCTVDTRFWSAEGTQIARKEKEAKILKTIDNMKEKDELTASQQAFVQRKHSTLAKLHNSFPRPSRKLYQGKENMILGLAMGLEKPATVAIVDGNIGKAIAFRSIKQLLRNNYKLLNRQRQQKQALSHLRHKAQKCSGDNQKGESNLGEYVDRLNAKAVVELAKEYQVSAIAVPKIEDMREIVQSEIKAKAEAKIPGYEEGQKKYAKQYRINIHNWSYGRLIENITIQASKLGIAIAEVKQPVRGSPTEKAKDIAIAKLAEGIALYNKVLLYIDTDRLHSLKPLLYMYRSGGI